MPKDSVRTQPVNPQGEIIYVVKKGDTLSSIGRKYGVSATELAKYNHLTNMNALQVGQKIKIKR
jgi:LysM repeat protein